jgi:hypothetical protein
MNTDQIPTEHRDVIARLYKGGDVLLPQLTTWDVDVLHAAIGIATEAGEMVEAILPMQIVAAFDMGNTRHGHARSPWEGNDGAPGVDIANIKEELGDHLFYEGALRIAAGLEELPDSVWIAEALWPHAAGPLSLANDPAVGRKRVLIDLVLIHSALAGQILDVAKRLAIYRTSFTIPKKEGELSLKERLVQHLVDDVWVVEHIAALIGCSEEELRDDNIMKLEKGKNARYREGYSDKAANDRADKELLPTDADVQAACLADIDRMQEIAQGVLADAIYGDGAEETKKLIAAQAALMRGVIAEGRDPDRVTSRTLLDGIELAPEEAVAARQKLSEKGAAN